MVGMTVMPYANKICVIRVTGRQLRDMLEYSASRYPAENGGFLQVSGVTFKIDSSVASSVVVDDNSMAGAVAHRYFSAAGAVCKDSG